MRDRTDAAAIRLTKRADFLQAAKGRKAHGALMTLQAHWRATAPLATPRIGFTVTKKVGGAVERNRIKRRLRELVRVTPDLGIKPSHDYVIIARRDVLSARVADLAAGLKAALRKVHGAAMTRAPSSKRPAGGAGAQQPALDGTEPDPRP